MSSDETETIPTPAKFFRISQLRRLRQCTQVAAVCYRVTKSIEFLLVQTAGGRWTFPKGCAEPGLTHAQSAALEAFEEAGVHGRIEEAPFTRYTYRKRDAESSSQELAVSAHLCEVSRLSPTRELHRNPTWFSVDKCKLHLQQDRTREAGRELTRVVDRAVSRIQRLRAGSAQSSQKTQLIEINRPRPIRLVGRIQAS